MTTISKTALLGMISFMAATCGSLDRDFDKFARTLQECQSVYKGTTRLQEPPVAQEDRIQYYRDYIKCAEAVQNNSFPGVDRYAAAEILIPVLRGLLEQELNTTACSCSNHDTPSH